MSTEQIRRGLHIVMIVTLACLSIDLLTRESRIDKWCEERAQRLENEHPIRKRQKQMEQECQR